MLALVMAPGIIAAPTAAQLSISRVPFSAGSTGGKLTTIGFDRGFVSPDDAKHPEVQFAPYRRDCYPSIEAVLFGSQHGRKALHEVVRLLDPDGDVVLTPNEKGGIDNYYLRAPFGCCGDSHIRPHTEANGVPVALIARLPWTNCCDRSASKWLRTATHMLIINWEATLGEKLLSLTSTMLMSGPGG